MAIDPSTNATMAGRITAADANYPFGSSKDETGAGANDGTPYFKARADDIFGLQQAILEEAGITPSGNADTAILSQYMEGLKKILKSGRKNLVHNGRGRIQQRPDGALSNSFVFGGDRWAFQAGGTVGAGTITTVTNAVAGNSGSAHRLTGVTLTGSGTVRGRSRYESLDTIEFKDQAMVISANVFHDVGSPIDYTITVNKADAKDDFSTTTLVAASSTISVASGVSVPISLAIADLGDVTNGIEIIIEADSGAVTTKAFEFTDIQAERGTVATVFEFRPIAEEEILVLRYFWVAQGTWFAWHGIRDIYANISGFISIPFPVIMRVGPTIIRTLNNGVAGTQTSNTDHYREVAISNATAVSSSITLFSADAEL